MVVSLFDLFSSQFYSIKAARSHIESGFMLCTCLSHAGLNGEVDGSKIISELLPVSEQACHCGEASTSLKDMTMSRSRPPSTCDLVTGPHCLGCTAKVSTGEYTWRLLSDEVC